MKTKYDVTINLDKISEVINIIRKEEDDDKIIKSANIYCNGVPLSTILSIIHKTENTEISYIYLDDDIFACHRRDDNYIDIYWFKIERRGSLDLSFKYSDSYGRFDLCLLLAITISTFSVSTKNSYSITESEYFNIIKNNENDKKSVLNNIIPKAVDMYMHRYGVTDKADSTSPIYTNPFLLKMIYDFNNEAIVFEKEFYKMRMMIMHG